MWWASSWAPRSPGLRSVTGLSAPRAGPHGCWTAQRASCSPGAGTDLEAPGAGFASTSRTHPHPSDSFPRGTDHTAVASPRARCAPGRPPHHAERVQSCHRGHAHPQELLSLFSGGSSAPAARPSVAPDLRPARASISLPTAHRPSWPCPQHTLPGGGPSSLPGLPGLHAPGCPGPFRSEPR